MEYINDYSIKSKWQAWTHKWKMQDAGSKCPKLWRMQADNMIISWILNAFSRDLAETFLYAINFYELWEEIRERYRENNHPSMYQLMKETSNISRGNNSLMIYYTKLKKLWGEYAFLELAPTCDCGVSKSLLK